MTTLLRYRIKLTSGETLAINTTNKDIDSIFDQSKNENKFFCLPGHVINKNEVVYIKVDGDNIDI